jgi:hypothetical protein
MSDSSSGANGDASGNNQGKDTVSHESFSKVLGEKKKAQEKLNELQSRLDEYEQAKLEAEGKLKEALDNQKKLTEKFKNDNVEIIKKVGGKAAKSQFTREVEKLGCIDAEAAFHLTDFSDLEMDADFEYDNKKLVEKIQGLTKSKGYLFKKDFRLPGDVTPSQSGIPSKGLGEMTTDQLKELLKTAK